MDETSYTMLNNTTALIEESPEDIVKDGPEDNKDEEEAASNGPAAESTAVEIENETTEADRMTFVRKQSKVRVLDNSVSLISSENKFCLSILTIYI